MYELQPPRVGKVQQGIDISTFRLTYMDLVDYLNSLSSNVSELHSNGSIAVNISGVSGEYMTVGPLTAANSYLNLFGNYAYLLQPIVFPVNGAIYASWYQPAGMTNATGIINATSYPTVYQASHYPALGMLIQVLADKQYYYYPYASVPADAWVDMSQFQFDNLLAINFGGSYGMSPLSMLHTFDGLVPKERYRIIPHFGIAAGGISLPGTGVYRLTAEWSTSSPAAMSHDFNFTLKVGG